VLGRHVIIKRFDRRYQGCACPLNPRRDSRDGQWPIRINDQWRLVFDLIEAGNEAHNVEIVDYH